MYTDAVRKIYCETGMEQLQDFAACPSLKRLQHVDMNCGMMYTQCAQFQKTGWFSRYQHSVDTALILNHFTQDPRQAIAGLLHDIAAPVFCHAVDFAKGDYMKQEATEERTEQMIREDEQLMRLLAEKGLKAEEVSDYHIYPLADNESPKLSADRLEYTLSNALNYGFADLSEIQEVYGDIRAGRNETGEEELVFVHEEQAVKFEKMMLQCTHVYTADDDRYGMEMLARLIDDMLKEHVICEDDLYTEEDTFIEKYLSEGKYGERWHHFTSLAGTRESENGIVIHAKKRWINPLVEGKGRVLSLHAELNRQAEEFIHETQDIKLEGVFKDGK